MATILITGGTGLVGKTLASLLKKRGHTIRVLTRNPARKGEFKWSLTAKYIDEEVFKELDYIIHLAGAGVADKRWTPKRKATILNSRVQSTELLYQKVKEHNIHLKGFISASATGYYGATTSDTIYTESDKPGTDFLAKVCVAWEQAALEFEKLGTKTLILRTGIVLSKQGGFLKKMKTPILMPLGSGEQWMPWIHMDDLCALYCKGIEDATFSGIFNAVAPEHQTNKSFSKLLAKKKHLLFLPIAIPAFLLRFFLGELSIILLTGSRISSKKLETSKFIFTFNTLNKALDKLLNS